MKSTRITYSLLVPLFVCLSLYGHAQQISSGHYPTRIFGPSDYEADQTVLCVLEDDNGFLLLANTDGVLVFNGTKWELVKLDRNSRVLWLAKDKSGKVYVAGEDEFGYLSLENNHYRYKSLIPLLPDTLTGFGSLWEVESTAYGVYFRSSRYLFWLHDESIDVLPYGMFPGGTFDIITAVNDTLYMRKREYGVGRIVKDKFELVSNGELFKDKKTNAIIRQNNRLLVFTRKDGIFQLTKSGFVPYAPSIREAVSEAKIYHAASKDNLLAIATLTEGVYLLNENGELIEHINEANYGINEAAYTVYFDKQGALWIGTLNGLARVEIQDGLKVHSTVNKKDHNIYAMARFNGRLFIGSHAGLFIVKGADFMNAEKVQGFSARINHIKVLDGVLMANGYEGSFLVDSSFNVTRTGVISDLHKMKEPPYYIGSGQEGLQLYKKTDKNEFESIRKFNVPNNMENVFEFDTNKIWAASSSAGLTYYDLKTDSTRTFLDLGNTRISTMEGVPYFVSSKGVFQYYDGRIRKASFFYDRIDSTQYTIQNIRSDSFGNVIVIYHDTQSKTYGLWLKKKQDGYDQLLLPDFGIKKTDFITTYLEDDGRLWIAGNKRIIEINLNRPLKSQTTFDVRVTSAKAGDRTLPVGSFKQSIPFVNNKLSFDFGSLNLSSIGASRYKYRLVGLQDDWSPWTEETTITYPYLPPGSYSFEVQGKSPYQVNSKIVTFQFEILEPWYFTKWASFIYVILLISVVISIVRIRSAKLKHDKKKLQEIISDRTEEIAEKNRKLEEMDKVKNHFYSNISHEFRTPLTLIIGPLEDYMETDEKPTKQAYQGLIKNAKRLLDLINQLLDLTKLEARQMPLDVATHGLMEYLTSVYASFEAMAKLKEIDFKLSMNHGENMIQFDEDHMDKILYNLLSNAFKFTPAGGVVSIASSGDEDSIQLIITDTGNGISKEHLPYIFDRFYQSHETHHVTQPGTGIGLSLVKELVTLHGGTVAVKSVSKQGSTFTVKFPRKQQPS